MARLKQVSRQLQGMITMLPALMIGLLFFLACSGMPSRYEESGDFFAACVRTDSTIFIAAPQDFSDHTDLIWSAEAGRIEPCDGGALFYAPSEPGKVAVTATIETGETIATHTLSVLVFKQYVILKADDLVYDRKSTLPSGWLRFIELIRAKKAMAALGVIGHYLDAADDKYVSRLKELASCESFELWNHGYTHQVGGSLMVNTDKPSEFYRKSYEQQRSSLEKCQKAAKRRLGITLRAFGAPGNAFDATTRRVIDESPDIFVWFFGDPGSRKMVLRRSGEIEFPTPHPSFYEFRRRYDPSRELYIYQIHPKDWNDAEFREFEQILDFLIANKVTFITPTRYYRLRRENREP